MIEKAKLDRAKLIPAHQRVQDYYDAIIGLISASADIEVFIRENRYALKLIAIDERNGCAHGYKECADLEKISTQAAILKAKYLEAFNSVDYQLELAGYEALPLNRTVFPDLIGEISRERLSQLLFTHSFRDNLRRLVNKYSKRNATVGLYELVEETLNMW